MEYTRLNAYHIMGVFIFFDLPTNNNTQRKRATKFRKSLEKDGFTMMQYSVYIRHCASKESSDVHIKRIKELMPPEGQVTVLTITDKQYGDILNYWGAKSQSLPAGPKQLELF